MRVLIVEDNVALARGLAQSLRDMGFAVDHHRTGGGVAEVALLEPYSLIVLDLILPKVSGFEILQAIRQRGSLVPIMILTVQHAIQDRVKGLNLCAADYLMKPFELAEFEARVRGARSGPPLARGAIPGVEMRPPHVGSRRLHHPNGRGIV